MSVWMYAIREFEDALDDCQQGCISCNDDPVHAWDEGVAFYAGSLVGEPLNSIQEGVMPYTLANRLCPEFRTCGSSNNRLEGNANINIRLFELFQLGQEQLQDGNCNIARVTKSKITQLMAVPLVQGTLRIAHQIGPQGDRSTRAFGEGAVMAATILPLVHDCNPDDAQTLYNNLAVSATATDFAIVKDVLERNYECMGISCSDIGGYYDRSNFVYHAGASPCADNFQPIAGYEPGSMVADHVSAAFILVFP